MQPSSTPSRSIKQTREPLKIMHKMLASDPATDPESARTKRVVANDFPPKSSNTL